jgi:hypothetical protein
MDCIAYRSGYKYQLQDDYSIQIEAKPPAPIDTEYLTLTMNGLLTVKKGYAWDGPSGPTIDTPNFMRGSLVHDALYQLMRERLIDEETYRETADRLLQKICIEDGMSSLRAWWVYQAVHFFGEPSADPANDKPVIKAPEGCS